MAHGTKPWTWTWTFLLLIAAACAAPKRTAPPSAQRLVSEQRVLVDRARTTRAQGPFQGSAERRLITRLWYSDAPGEGPACRRGRCALVLLAHGYGGHVQRLTDFARAVAAAGYIVAAPLFPLTSDAAPGGYLPGFDDVANQPGDLSFVLDQLLEAAGDRADPLYGRIDRERVGAVGHSMGGTTLIGATRLACCSDRRLAAAVLVAPAIDRVRPAFGEAWRQSGPPTLIVVGTDDVVVPLTMARAFCDAIEPPRALVELRGANHVDLMENGSDRSHLLQTEQMAIAFFHAYLGSARAELEAALAAARAAGENARWDE